MAIVLLPLIIGGICGICGYHFVLWLHLEFRASNLFAAEPYTIRTE
jgi:hypothetical protein